MLKLTNISIYFAYFISAAALIFGITLITGLAFGYVPDKFRIMFGVVLTLVGIYRFVVTRTRLRQQKEDEEE